MKLRNKKINYYHKMSKKRIRIKSLRNRKKLTILRVLNKSHKFKLKPLSLKWRRLRLNNRQTILNKTKKISIKRLKPRSRKTFNKKKKNQLLFLYPIPLIIE